MVDPAEAASTGNHHLDLGPDEGVIYAPDVFAGLMQRLMVLIIDVGVLAALCFAIYVVHLPSLEQNASALHVWMLLSWIYLTVIKPSRLRTIGYRMIGVRIVTLRGERPSFLRMTFRMALSVFGPFSIWIDLPWLASDPWKQSLRDKLAATYVIRNDAVPVAKGIRRASYYDVLGYLFACWEVRPVVAQEPSTSA